MKRRGLAGTVFMLWVVAVLAVILTATYFITTNFLFLGWHFYPRHQQVLDIRQRNITYEEYDTLAWQMPDTEILWSVPFQGAVYPQDTQELTVSTFREEDLRGIRYFPRLTTVWADSCMDYAALAALSRENPHLKVSYQVPIGGKGIPSDARTVALTSLSAEDAAMLVYLPKLVTLDGSACRDYDVLHQVKQNHPEWKVILPGYIAGTPISESTVTLEVEGAHYEELSVGLSAMSSLKSLLVRNPAATAQELQQLVEEYPNVEIHWEVEIFGNAYGEAVTELDISNRPITSIEQAKELAAKFPNLEKLIVDSGNVPDEDMAKYREEVRDSYKVVWTVYFTPNCKARTDETYFMPIKQGEYYFQDQHVYNLRYCEDMVCIDIGHSTVKDVSFASFMPHLKYLILAWTQVTDISPLSNCKELVYLEIDHGIVHDYSPLLGCTALEDININDAMVSVSVEPLCQMTWLKNLWCTDRSYRDKMLLTESLPNTRVVITEISSSTGMGWRNLQNYYDMRDYLGMYYMD